MATFDFTLTDQHAGRVLGVPDGYLVNLTMTTGAVHEVPDFDPSKQHFKTGYLTRRGERDHAPLINVQPAVNGGAFCWFGPEGNMLLNGSLGYAGDLI